jgi:hypothetical protein
MASEAKLEAKQDIHIHCLSLDRARSRDKQWALAGTGASPPDGFSEGIGDCSDGRERSAAVAAGGVASPGGSVFPD